MYIIHLQIFSRILCFVLHREGSCVRPLQTSNAALLLAKTSLNIFKQMSGRFHICLWSRKTEVKVMTFALKFFPHWLMCIHLCFSFVNYSSGILSSVLNRIFPQILCQLPQILNFYFFFNKMFVVILTKFAGHLSVTSVLYLNKFKSVYGISDTQMSTSGLYFLLLVPQEANQGQIF